MSVVLVTPDHYDTIRKTIQCLRAQTAREQLELVIVAPSARELQLNRSELADFDCFQVVEVGPIRSIAGANAAGARHARAPVVAFGEDHAFPEPDWAQALIDAHRGPWITVGPEVRNANPQTAISWADFLMGYGPWMSPAPGGEIAHLPGHNSSYKRDPLLRLSSELETMLEAETVFHWELVAAGQRLYLEPKARIAHVNFERFASWLPALFHSGRTFAAVRSRQWNLNRRLFYAAAAPAIPLTRLTRIVRQLRAIDKTATCPPMSLRILFVLALGLITSALGEMLGYAFGAGSAPCHLTRFEFHRERHNALTPTLPIGMGEGVF
ncbi:MAG TPA: glycosyltransferase [Candidatus Eisenbacteria bacterium]|nr:glycosyltransferase [Candidatus Eisenbacteria bacterium]